MRFAKHWTDQETLNVHLEDNSSCSIISCSLVSAFNGSLELVQLVRSIKLNNIIV